MATGRDDKKLPDGGKGNGGLSPSTENQEAFEIQRKDLMARGYNDISVADAENLRIKEYSALLSVGETWCSSVVQPLYFIMSFRRNLLEYFERRMELNVNGNENNENSVLALARLFSQINRQERQSVMDSSKSFEKIAESACVFDSLCYLGQTHQDAYTFLNFLFNEIEREKDSAMARNKSLGLPLDSLLKEFRGTLSDTIGCVKCGTLKGTEKSFFSLTVDVGTNLSLTYCLRYLSCREILYKQRPCEHCGSHLEAETNVISKAPEVLVIRLQRFKRGKRRELKKLLGNVWLTHRLQLQNTKELASPEYKLSAIVLHQDPTKLYPIGYTSLTRSGDKWISFLEKRLRVLDDLKLQLHSPAAVGVVDINSPKNDIHLSWSDFYILFFERIRRE